MIEISIGKVPPMMHKRQRQNWYESFRPIFVELHKTHGVQEIANAVNGGDDSEYKRISDTLYRWSTQGVPTGTCTRKLLRCDVRPQPEPVKEYRASRDQFLDEYFRRVDAAERERRDDVRNAMRIDYLSVLDNAINATAYATLEVDDDDA